MPDQSELLDLVRSCIETSGRHMPQTRREALKDAVDRGDLVAIHTLLVRNSLELFGLDRTQKLLEDVDRTMEEAEAAHARLH